MIVVDASVVVCALGDDGPSGDSVRARLRDEELVAPELIDVEVVSAWRRTIRDEHRGAQALADLSRLRMVRVSHLPLLERMWQLRGNLSAYDAAYVALAERLGVTLLTGDGRIAKVKQAGCEVEVLR